MRPCWRPSVSLGESGQCRGKGGRNLSFVTMVHFNGNLLGL